MLLKYVQNQQDSSIYLLKQKLRCKRPHIPFSCICTSIKWVAGCFKNVFLCLLCDQVQASQDKQPVIKTVGPLTDVDVIKLRPCEKKKVGLSPPSLVVTTLIKCNLVSCSVDEIAD